MKADQTLGSGGKRPSKCCENKAFTKGMMTVIAGIAEFERS